MDRKLYVLSDEYAIDTIEEKFASESVLQRMRYLKESLSFITRQITQ